MSLSLKKKSDVLKRKPDVRGETRGITAICYGASVEWFQSEHQV
jgi:hypothetical protein